MARRPSSVRPSVCKLLRKSLLIAGKWPDRYQTFTRWTPGQRASRVCSRSRSKVTWYGHFCAGTKIASSHMQVAQLRPNLHTMVPSRIYMCAHLPKFNVYLLLPFVRSVFFRIRIPIPKMAVSLCCEWRHSSHGETVCQTDNYTVGLRSDLTFSLYVRSLYEAPLHSPSSIRQLNVMSKSWNVLLRLSVIDCLVFLSQSPLALHIEIYTASRGFSAIAWLFVI